MSTKTTKSKTLISIEGFKNFEIQFPQIQAQLDRKLMEKLVLTEPITNIDEFRSYSKPLEQSLEKYAQTFSSFSRSVTKMQETDDEMLDLQSTAKNALTRVRKIQDDLACWNEQTTDKIMLHNMALGYFMADPTAPEPTMINSDPENEIQSTDE